MAALLFLLAASAGAEWSAAPEYRVEVLVRDLPYALDAIQPFSGTLFVSVGASLPGGRLLRLGIPMDASVGVPAQNAMTMWSASRLSPIVAYHFTGRVHAGVPEQGRVIKIPELPLPWGAESAENLAAAHWTPETLVVGLTAIHDMAFASDGRLLIADGGRVLETPIYFTPGTDAARFRIAHRCSGACRGVAIAANGDLFVLDGLDSGGQIVRRGPSGSLQVLATGLPRPGEGLRLGPRGDLYFTSEMGLLGLAPGGGLTRILSSVGSQARVNVDPDGNLLVADPVGGVVLRIRVPAE